MAPWMVKLIPNAQNNLSKESVVDCFQIRSIAEERCIKKIGLIDNDAMNKIWKSLSLVLNID